MLENCLITTADNPWNPYTNWDEWYRFDMQHGYDTCGRLSRLAPIAEFLPETIQNEILSDAMEQMLKEGAISKEGNFTEYKLVYKNNKTDTSVEA